MHRLRHILLFLLPMISVGQNLVPNPSFEDSGTCPFGSSCSGQLECAIGWYDPINCTSDFYHADSACAVPTTFSGIYPKEGVGMAAIALITQTGENQREYVGIELAEALVSDSLYELKVYLRLGWASATTVGSIGAFFSPDSATDYSINHQWYDLNPQLQRNPNSLMSDPNIWYEWTDTLIADGDERYLLLGNFLNDSNTPHQHQSTTDRIGYYFLDDIRVIPVSKPNGVSDFDITFSIYPNPATTNLTIESRTPLAQVWVRDVAGRAIMNETLRSAQSDKSTIDVSALPSGIYLVEVLTQNGQRSVQKVMVE